MRGMVENSNDMSSEAMWRNFLTQLLDLLLGVGVVQTEDAGQCVPESDPWGQPGYFVFRMNDAAQAELPIYFRLDFSEPSTSVPSTGKVTWRAGIGRGSDGRGNITDVFWSGIVGNRLIAGRGAGVLGAVATDGFFCVFGSYGSNSGPSLAICRTCDSEGVANGFGATVFAGASGILSPTGHNTIANIKSGPPYVQTVSGIVDFESALLKPFNLGHSISGELPAYLSWHALPEIMPMHGVCGVLAASMTRFDTFSVALVGNTPRSYLVLGYNVFDNYTASVGGDPRRATMAILWE